MNVFKISAAATRTKVLITMLLAFGFIFSGFNSISLAKDVTLQWDANPESDNIAYYKVYYDDDASGPPYDGTGLFVNEVSVASGFPVDESYPVIISGLNEDKIYYFAVTAVDGDGLESDVSNEVRTLEISSITSTSPDGAYKTGDVIDIVVNFSEPVTLSSGGNITISLDTGDTLNINEFTNLAAVSVSYSIDEGDNSKDLNVTGFSVTSGILKAGTVDVPQSLPGGRNLADNKDISVDGTSPVSKVSAPSSGDGELSVSWSASDSNSGVASTSLWYVKIAADPVWIDTGLPPQAGTSGTFYFTPLDGAGTYLFASRSTDIAGNIESLPADISEGNATVYLMTPEITTSGGGDFSTSVSAIILEGTADSQTAGIEINDAAISYTPGSLTWSHEIDLSPGANIITVAAVDAYGNVTSADTITITYDTSGATPPTISEEYVIPHNNAGITDTTRIPDSTSFGVRLKDSDGIDLTDPESVSFTVSYNGYEYTVSTGDSDVVKYVVLSGTETAATDTWVVYHKSKDELAATFYDFGAVVTVDVMARDVKGYEMGSSIYRFKIETSGQNAEASADSPDVTAVSEGLDDTFDSGIEVADGASKGIKVLYSSVHDVVPAAGPDSEVPALKYSGFEAVSHPFNLQPPTVFSVPAKLYIPFDDGTDVSGLSIFLYNGSKWVLACDADGNVEAGGDGLIVRNSRINHDSNDRDNPSTIEIQVYSSSSVATGLVSSNDAILGVVPNPQTSGEGGGGGGGCFITTVADRSGDTSGFQRILILFGFIVLLGLLGWKFKNESIKKA